jgi:transcriptional regulator with XRE-family HTH domain
MMQQKTDAFYWMDKAGNMYGPFPVQEDGFPNAGEVVRFYRELRGMTRTELASRLGDKERWVRKMENQNAVPEMISRRRLIAQILGIPTILLGVASLGEDSFLKRATPEFIPSKTVSLGKSNLKILEQEYSACWGAYYTKGAKTVLSEVNHQIQYIELLLDRGGLGSNRETLLMQLCGFDQLRSDIARQLKTPTPSTDRMVELALELSNPELSAITLYRRSRWYLYEGDYASSLRDVKHALTFVDQAKKPVQGDVLSGAGVLLAQVAQDKGELKEALSLIDRSNEYLDYHQSEDPWFTRFGEGFFWINRAEAFIYGARNDPSLINEAFNSLQEAGKTTPKSLGGRRLRIDALYAHAAFVSGEPLVAASTALTTLERVKGRGDMRILGLIQRLHTSLAASYGNLSEVKELGYQLKLR